METNNTNANANRRFVMIRTDTAGVHFGYLAKEEMANDGHYAVTLENARRVWSWSGANCLSELSTLGSSKPSECKISIPVTSIKLMAIEIIDITPKAQANLESISHWTTVAAN